MAAIVRSPSRTASSPAPTPAPSQSQSQTYFEIVTSNLLKLGALTLEDFLRDPYQEPAPPQENFLSNPLYHDAPVAPSFVLDDNQDGGENGKPAQMPAPIFVLHQICSQTFGSIDALDYEIIEEEGKEKKRCILTITRPNGATRSYTSKPEFSRKAEARAAAAAIAVDMGAIDFIKHGSPEAVAKRGLVLAPLDAPGSVQEPSPNDAEEDPAVKKIEKCCAEWRAGRVKPRWIFLIDSKPNGKYGCALQVKLSMHLFRVFSVDVVHPTFEEAKAMCAADAILEGILDFIKFGNGQTAPAERRLFQEDDTTSAPPIALTLQGYFEALPRPLPEPVDDKTVGEINAPGWLNGLLQSARGGKFEHKFIWTTDTKLGTHGAVLRLTRPDEVRTYMVEPQFPKRADAKNAVCLASLAAGVGAYVRSVSGALETKISPETKTLVLESILPLLTTEYAKYWPNKVPEMFEYTKDRDACGCILTFKLPGEPEEHEKRSWTAPADFRNRNDAKIAVLQLAFEQGAIEFLRFRGEPPPEGYKVELPAPRESRKAKRKGTDGAENEGEGTKKKSKLLSQSEQFLAAAKLPTKPTVSSRSSTSSFSQMRGPATGTTSGAAVLLPRPGYIDPKPEDGELPAEPPKQEPELLPASLPRRPVTQPLEYPPRHAAESSSYNRFQGDPTRSTPYDTREHGRQYEPDGDPWYEGPGAYAPDPYYAPPPASHMEPWHTRHSGHVYPEEEGYRHRPYCDPDYGHDYDYDLAYDHDYGYDYERERYAALPPPLPPLPPGSGPAHHGYADFEHSGYDYGYAHERDYSHDHSYMQHPPPPPPLPPHRVESAAASMSGPGRGGPPSRSPPRVWQPGPRATEAQARWSGTGEPRDPPMLLPRAPATAEPRAPPPESAPAVAAAVSSSSSSSSSSTPAGPLVITRTPSERVPKRTPSPSPSKDELFEYCRVHGYPRPQFFVSLDDSANAAVEPGVAATNAIAAASPANVRYKVWVVLGPERLELPKTYTGIKEGEEKMARKVLRHLRSRDVGEGME